MWCLGGWGEEPAVLKIGGWLVGGAGSIILGVYFEREEGGRREPLLFNSILSGVGWGWGVRCRQS